ncbi:IS5 family transposase [Halomonas sp. AOP27-A1-41]|uniref:IS5 family transposase n=1 Tax=Halomonas sp. AOP27-A1-41 TaxID=3457707 RepID=UPI00403358FC
MTRYVLTDDIWEQLQVTMKAKGCHRWPNDRNVMEAILWKLRTGAPWRDVPSEFCPWKTAYNRFNRWATKGLWEQFFFELRGEIDAEWVFADGSYLRAHQHASGARHGEERAIGKSRGGATTKLHMLADAHGNPVDFEVTGGNVHDATVAEHLIKKVDQADHFIADKGYDSEGIRDHARAGGINPIIPKRSNNKTPNPEFDAFLYRHRHLVENLFARLKHFRSIATRFEKLARNFKSMVYLACTFIWLKMK